MKLSLPLSLPAIAGITSWLLSWAFAFAPLRYNPYAYDVQRIFNVLFVLVTWIGPFAAILAIIAIYRSSWTSPKRVALYLLNAVWGIFSLVIFVHFWFAHRR
jgi:hypothetical protein